MFFNVFKQLKNTSKPCNKYKANVHSENAAISKLTDVYKPWFHHSERHFYTNPFISFYTANMSDGFVLQPASKVPSGLPKFPMKIFQL